jgi:hypothetical protein
MKWMGDEVIRSLHGFNQAVYIRFMEFTILHPSQHRNIATSLHHFIAPATVKSAAENPFL